MNFGSVCSGIEAASVAWGPLGWMAAWLAEIEPFPSAVLAHHYPEVPNLGDMTTISRRVLTGEVEAPDILCGGTPCQAFSVAGLRQSLDDERGNLTLKFVGLANAIDHVRTRAGKPACIVFWENVPGVLSTKDNAFGCFLAGLAGEDDPLEPPGAKWANAGAVFGPTRTVAWRTLDAQYFGVAQRRRRVFIVASARDVFDPCQVLFEWPGVRRDSAPRREAGEAASARSLGGAESSGWSGSTGCNSVSDCMHGAGTQHSKTATAVAPTIPARTNGGGGLGTDFDCDGGLITAYGGNNQSGPINVATARNACASASGRMDFETETFLVQPVAFPANLSGTQYTSTEDLAPAMGATNPTAVAFAIQAGALRTNPASGPDGVGVQSDHAYTLEARAEVQAVAVTGQITHALNTANNGQGSSEDGTGRGVPTVATHMQVRRLTPRECEALQGFPLDYTAIPWRKKPASECPDGPRYKALGNSWAVPVARWIGQRIDTAIRRES